MRLSIQSGRAQKMYYSFYKLPFGEILKGLEYRELLIVFIPIKCGEKCLLI